ncbi:MAG: rhodanese-like domain-containing protein [Pelagimonas sp.]|jgi:rhodanese-related sulfurtransferase|nr:rhodanese-like domain-containing protein [Pelagimonas sp.]
MFGLISALSGTDMKADEAVNRAAKHEIIVIDIREPGEVQASGKAKGALAIPSAALRMKADPTSPECLPELKSGKPIAVYCASGARSAMAKGMLKRMGHEVHNIGGLGHWVRAGGEIGK